MRYQMETRNQDQKLDLFFEWYNRKKRNTYQRENKRIADGSIVFFGDSITDNYKLKEYFPQLQAVNRGISGNTVLDLIRRITVSVADARPSKIVLLVGINDLMNLGRSAYDTAKRYRKLLELLQEHCPNIPIICQSVYPGYDAPKNKLNKGIIFPLADKAEEIVKLNVYIQKLCGRYGCSYVDLHSHLAKADNTMNPIYSNDGCHPNEAGYELITRVLLPYLSDPDPIAIWGEQIPYNTGKPKKDVMELHPHDAAIDFMEWAKDVFGRKPAASSIHLDTHTWREWIAKGEASESFDDVPTIQPYLAKGADTGIVIAPGGGFCYESMEDEGHSIARFLNSHGISAFVLKYRLNPYEAPVCYLDMQRAIRFVRHHAAEYGLDPHKIGAMGFSAGGYVTGAAAILLGNKSVECEGYCPDEVDAENGLADFLGMIYPVTGFTRNPSMLALIAGDDFFDEEKRPALQQHYDLASHVSSECPPQFICYGGKDPLKDMIDYHHKLEAVGADYTGYIITAASHGFSLKEPMFRHWGAAYVDWIKNLGKADE